MCTYCTCQENDNTRYHGMRLKSMAPAASGVDNQADENYTWTNAQVTNNGDNVEQVPAVGYGSTGGAGAATPIRLGTD